MKGLYLVTLICLAVGVASAVGASDLNFGTTARSIALGGAGVALGAESGADAIINPAAPAVNGRSMHIVWPGLGMYSTGASFSDLTNSINKLSNGSSGGALDLVNDFAKHPTTLSFDSEVGFTGPIGVTMEAEAEGVVTPAPAAQDWANAALAFQNGSLNLADLQKVNNATLQDAVTNWTAYSFTGNAANKTAAEADFNNYLSNLSTSTVQANVVYSMPTVALSTGVNTSRGKLWYGTNVEFLHSEAHTWAIQGAADPNGYHYNGNSLTGVDVGFNAVEQPVVKSDTVKADIGAISGLKNPFFRYGVVVNNVIQPELKGITDTVTQPMVSMGVAAIPSKRLVLAADVVNLNRANDENVQLRMGGEFRLTSFLTARAGYSGQNWTYGVGLLGVDFAFDGRTAQMLSHVLKF